MDDPYRKLRPLTSTPADELCTCVDHREIYLAHKLGSNPLFCLNCNGGILPEAIPLDPELVDAIASWNSTFGALYALWLDSGEYEKWAESKLLDPKGQVNQQGLLICHSLLSSSDAYYLWFYSEASTRPTRCPFCSGPLSISAWHDRMACHECKVVL